MAENNTFRNNIFIAGGDARITLPKCTNMTFEKNILMAGGASDGCESRWKSGVHGQLRRSVIRSCRHDLFSLPIVVDLLDSDLEEPWTLTVKVLPSDPGSDSTVRLRGLAELN